MLQGLSSMYGSTDQMWLVFVIAGLLVLMYRSLIARGSSTSRLVVFFWRMAEILFFVAAACAAATVFNYGQVVSNSIRTAMALYLLVFWPIIVAKDLPSFLAFAKDVTARIGTMGDGQRVD